MIADLFPSMIHDRFTIKKDSLNMVGIHWLMSSYLYYRRPDLESYLTDYQFDHLTQILIERFDELKDLDYGTISRLITRDRLQAGSGFDITEDEYPNQCKNAAVSCAKDSFWTLRQEFIFNYPNYSRVGYFYEMDSARKHPNINRDKIISNIYEKEPLLQNPERYHADSAEDELERTGALLKDREATEFYEGIIFQIDKEMEDGLVLGRIFYEDGKGWIGQVFDPTRSISIA